MRRASDNVNYAITVCEGNKICSYKVTDLGLGQVGIQTGQSFRSLEYLLEFFYEEKFPDATGTHVPLKHMCTEPERQLDVRWLRWPSIVANRARAHVAVHSCYIPYGRVRRMRAEEEEGCR